ncbi:MAG: F0F1 ATP synthase subunit B [Oscillospiraceae bacterium]|nr:F0F1 ATP synthase subunit B [Oscillospiraceae bacterium]
MDFGIILSGAPEGYLFNLSAQTFIQVCAHLINIAILAIILSKVLYKPVRNFLQGRSDKIRSQLEQAGDDYMQATELKHQYEQKLKDIDHECNEILDEARKQAAETVRKIVADAKKEADAIMERASANVDMEWERAQAAMRLAIIEVSEAMTEKFVKLAINKETRDRLFEEAMDELEGITWRS